MKKLFWIGLAGAAGTFLRTAIGQLINDGSGFPIATFLVNIVGTFFLCAIIAGAFRRLNSHKEFQEAVTTGFLGSFTTFSALSMETVLLMENGRFAIATLYIVSSIVGGLVAGVSGFHFGGKRVKG